MEFFKPGTTYNIMGQRKSLGIMSIVMVLSSWVLVGVMGLNFSIEFVGGTEALVQFNKPVDVATLRESVAKTGLDSPEVVSYGTADEARYFVRSRTQNLLSEAESEKVKAAIVAKIGEPKMWDTTDTTGEEIRVQFDAPPKEADLIAALHEAGFEEGSGVLKQSESSNPVFMLQLPGVRSRLEAVLKADFAEQFTSIDRLESVGSSVGAQLRNQGILAVLYALIGILLYVGFRFDITYSPGAVIALVHDISITLGIFALTQMEFSLTIVAALLAIVGYSINDTVVIFDRIREMIAEGRSSDFEEVLNISISDILSRTVLTSVTTMIAVVFIYLFGAGAIKGFAFAMMVGIIVGTYSSIYIASSLVLTFDELRARRQGNTAISHS